jgi:hypothetical protein
MERIRGKQKVNNGIARRIAAMNYLDLVSVVSKEAPARLRLWSFDFSYFDAAVDEIATARRRDFDAAVDDSERLPAGWTVIPILLVGLVILLVPLGVRKRLAEYR